MSDEQIYYTGLKYIMPTAVCGTVYNEFSSPDRKHIDVLEVTLKSVFAIYVSMLYPLYLPAGFIYVNVWAIDKLCNVYDNKYKNNGDDDDDTCSTPQPFITLAFLNP